MAHIHAELIKQWADGAKIQFLDVGTGVYMNCPNNLPKWNPESKYRVKPEARLIRVAEFKSGKLEIVYAPEFKLVQNAPEFKKWVTDIYEVEQ